MGTATISEKGGNRERGEVRPGAGPDAPDNQADQPGGSCGLLGQIDDDRADVALTTGGVTRLVDRMVEAGLVARENCPSDRRSIFVVLTPQGHAVLERAVAEHIAGIDRHLMAHLSDSDRAALEASLLKVLDAGC
jgi:hypothetical protein